MQNSQRPVILLGQGARAAGVDCAPLMDLGIPVLTSWLGKDLVDNWHPMYFGSPGVYGNRIANRVLWEADCVIAIGCRLPIWVVGYEGLRPDQRLIMVDCDENETRKFPKAEIHRDIACFIADIGSRVPADIQPWLQRCHEARELSPFIEEVVHSDTDGYINSFRFTAEIQKYLKPDSIIVTDAGNCMVPAFQVLRLKPPQRIITSGGIGEMGCSLPLAIGASFARNKGEVWCLVGDGGIMMCLHELQTIVHHQLPIKIIVYANDGYGMIKQSQKALGVSRTGTDRATGLSTPSMRKVSQAMGMLSMSISGDFREQKAFRALKGISSILEPALIEFRMDPEQFCGPKLNPIREADGTIRSPEFWDMTPRMP